MAALATVILRVVAEIRCVGEGIDENDRQASRLLKRVMTIEPPVLAVQEGSNTPSPESLRQLLVAVEKIRDFLEGYARTTKFIRALKRKANAAEFKQLGDMLAEGVQALPLGVAVDTWAREDASDRLEDLEIMVANSTKVTCVLKALRKDERAELKAWMEIAFDKAWIEIDFNKDLDFRGSTLLGSGSFGEVRTAKWNKANVAVKHLLTDGLRRDDVCGLREEIRLHSSLRCDHVVQLYAASTIPPNLCLVTEFARQGSLWEYLHETSEPLEHELQAAFLLDIARGMLFLHRNRILHGNLKSSNVLMFDNCRLKLCDFGFSTIKAESSSRTKRGAVVGAAQWMSPEEMEESPENELTDVYSFGIVCYEVATRMEPFKGLKQAQVIRAVADKGKRPEIPEGASASPDVVWLMEQCWKQDPADRPEGFRLVTRDLASVVSRDGDPRIHSVVAEGATPPSSQTPANKGWRVPGFLSFVERRFLGDGGFKEVVDEESVERPSCNGRTTAPRFRFEISQSDFLVISEDDANAVLDLVNKTGLREREPSDVCGMLMSMAEDGVLSREAFARFIEQIVPASRLSKKDKWCFSTLLNSVYTCFDRDGSSFVDAIELATGFSILCAGSKSAKMDFAFGLHDEDGDGRLSRRGLLRYTRSFLTALMALSTVALELPTEEFAHAVYDGAVWTNSAIFATVTPTPNSIGFNEIADWYTYGGFRGFPWLELLHTDKWKVPTTPPPSPPAASGEAPAVPAPGTGATDAG
eukprot:g10253.t1